MKDDLTTKVDIELRNLQNKMKDTLRAEEERGASLAHLGKQSQELEERANIFEETAEETKWKMWYKVVKWYVIGAVIVILIISVLFFR